VLRADCARRSTVFNRRTRGPCARTRLAERHARRTPPPKGDHGTYPRDVWPILLDARPCRRVLPTSAALWYRYHHPRNVLIGRSEAFFANESAFMQELGITKAESRTLIDAAHHAKGRLCRMRVGAPAALA